jgi:hypothetical protein
MNKDIFNNEYVIYNISQELGNNKIRRYNRPNLEYKKLSCEDDDFNLLYKYSIIRRN